MSCSVTGTAAVKLVDGKPEWDTWNDRIHITRELVEDDTAWAFIGQKYDLRSWCDEVGAFHAHLRGDDE